MDAGRSGVDELPEDQHIEDFLAALREVRSTGAAVERPVHTGFYSLGFQPAKMIFQKLPWVLIHSEPILRRRYIFAVPSSHC
mgnify:CR=1 FL=1